MRKFTNVPIVQKRTRLCVNIGLNVDEDVVGADIMMQNIRPSPRRPVTYISKYEQPVSGY